MKFTERSKASPFYIEDSGRMLYFNDGVSERQIDGDGLRQSEYMIFCKGEGGDESQGVGYHKQYMIFNTQITKEEYENISIPKDKLEFDINESYKTRYKTAFKKMWDGLDSKGRQEYLDLPHFNKEIFKDITGIDVDIEVQEMTVEQICKELGRNIKIVK